MSRVVVSTYVTLDGVVEDPQDWLFPFWGAEVGKYAHDQLVASDALLVGRVGSAVGVEQQRAARWQGERLCVEERVGKQAQRLAAPISDW